MDLTGITPLYPTTPLGRPAGVPGEIPGVRRSKVVRVPPDIHRETQVDLRAGCADMPSTHAADAELVAEPPLAPVTAALR